MESLDPPARASGFSSAVYDSAAEDLNIHHLLVKHPAATYFMRCATDSMTHRGIYRNDLLVCDRALTPCDNDVVVVLYKGDFWVRTLHISGSILTLHADAHCEPITLTNDECCQWYGVVTSCIHLLHGQSHILPREM